MAVTRRKFTLEFKTEAAHRVIDSDRTVREVAPWLHGKVSRVCVPHPEDVMTVLATIELYEDDEICDGPILVVETGFDRAEVDEILDYLWRADRIECRRMTAADGSEMLTGIRRLLEGRERRWGEFVRYQSG